MSEVAAARRPAGPGLAPRPPFRADQVGSLLRPPELKIARADHAAGRLDAAGLRAIEDRLIADAIQKQKAVGLCAVTDGEFRRGHWGWDFLAGLDGVELVEPKQKIRFAGTVVPNMPAVTGKIAWNHPVFVDDFRFVASQAGHAVAKQTIPSPPLLHFRAGRPGIDAVAYPELDAFYADLGAAYRQAVAAFAEAGCTYLQLDEVDFAHMCDPNQLDTIRARGESTDGLLETYAALINASLRDRPADMTVSMHLCRGNFRSSWASSGGYEPVAEMLFNGVDVDAWFLEYDSDRAGGFEPLRFVPKGEKIVVLGLVTSKSGELESRDAIRRRIDEATKYVALDQLALSPQCGFASTEDGNKLTEDQQWAKLRLCVELAREIWGPG